MNLPPVRVKLETKSRWELRKLEISIICKKKMIFWILDLAGFAIFLAIRFRYAREFYYLKCKKYYYIFLLMALKFVVLIIIFIMEISADFADNIWSVVKMSLY